MGTDQLTLVVIGKDWKSVTAFDRTHVDCKLIEIGNAESFPLSQIANRYLDSCKTLVFGLSHADVQYNAGALDAFTEEALRGSVCGIVGIDLARKFLCCYKRPLTPEPVSTLDGMAVFFRKDLGLRFDEEIFNGMHCHVEDLCLQAQKKSIPITVPSADAHHITHEITSSWVNDYRTYRRKLTQKWLGVEFATTT